MGLLDKKKNIPAGVKASIAFFIASLISNGISYITTPIFTRLLTSAEYGQVSVYFTCFQIFGTVAMFCLASGVFSVGMHDHPDNRDEYSFSMLILSNVITLCFTAVLFSIYPLVKEFLEIDVAFIILMCVAFFFQPAYSFWMTRQRFELKYKQVLIFSSLSAVLSSAVAIVCILINKNGENLYPRIFGAEITLIVIYISFYIYLGLKSKFRVNFKYWKTALLFNAPLIPHYLSNYLLGSSDKIMISALESNSATALYSVAHSVAVILLVAWSAVNATVVPFTYDKCKTKDYKGLNKVIIPLVALFAVLCVALSMLAPEVVFIMSTKEYMQAIYVIPPIIGGLFFQIHYHLYVNVLYYNKKPFFIMVGSILSASCNILLNYIFIPKYGYVAAGYTTLFCFMLQATIDYVAMRVVAKEKVYDMKYIGALSLFVIVTSLISVLIYDYWYIRYGIICLILVFAIIFRKKIISLLKIKTKEKEKTDE